MELLISKTSNPLSARLIGTRKLDQTVSLNCRNNGMGRWVDNDQDDTPEENAEA
jgi:hypothetical protein